MRGSGLFLGVELVRDRDDARAGDRGGALRRRIACATLGILAGTDGPYHNVLKIRPPLIFSEEDADLFVERLDEVLSEDAAS